MTIEALGFKRLDDLVPMAFQGWMGDNTIRYRTFSEYTLDSSLKTPQNLVLTPGYTFVSIKYTPPADYDTTPSDYPGFVVSRSIGSAPQKPTDGTIVYAGRKSMIGSTLDVGSGAYSSDILYADKGLKSNTEYYYSVFLLNITNTSNGFKYTYSSPLTGSTTTTNTAPKNLFGANGDFSSGNIAPWTEEGPSISVIDNDDNSTNKIFAKCAHLEADAKGGTTSKISYTYEIDSSKLNPNQFYTLIFWTRGNDALFTPTVNVSGSDSITIVDLPNSSSSNGNFQSQQELSQEDADPTEGCTPANNSDCKRHAAYSQGAISQSYLYPTNYGVWQKHGIAFITGDTTASDIVNKYGSPVQKPWDGTTGKTLISIDCSVAGSKDGSGSGKYADFGAFELYSGLPPETDFINLLSSGDNIIQNTHFDGPNSSTFTDWATSNVQVVRESSGPFYLEFSASCTDKAQLYQNMYWLSMVGGEQYSIEFDVAFDTSAVTQDCQDPPQAINLDNLVLTVEMMDGFANDIELTSGSDSGNAIWEISASDWAKKAGPSKSKVHYKFPFVTKNDVPRPRLSFTMDQKVAGQGSNHWKVQFANPKLPASGKEYSGDFPVPAPVAPSAVSSGGDDSTHTLDWKFDSADSTKSVLQNLFENTAYNKTTDLGKGYGLLCLAQKDSVPSNLKFVSSFTSKTGSPVNTPALEITAYGDKHSDQTMRRIGATVTTPHYYAGGRLDLDFQYGQITGATDPSGQPIGCCLASWVFNYISFDMTGSASLLGGANPILNSEIDIEMPASCDRGGSDWDFTRGRLNGWGGKEHRGEGGNFEMHWTTPPDSSAKAINVADGNPHTISIVWNSGYDLSSGQTATKTKQPGFIKWLVDGKLWSCGWVGNSYGSDNVPFRGMRWVVGLWFPSDSPSGGPGWAGSPQFDTVKLYITKMTYNPLDFSDSESKPAGLCDTPPMKNATANKPPNCDTFNPESSPMMHYDPYGATSFFPILKDK